MWFFKPKTPHPKSVLFICTANVTRSPAAEVMFKSIAEKSGEEWQADSAGIKAYNGSPANTVMAMILHQRGLKLHNHKSKRITTNLLQRFQWFVVMEKSHRDTLLEIAPHLSERVFIMRELAGTQDLDVPDMPDPTGKDPEDYRELMTILDVEIQKVWIALNDRASHLIWNQK